jgi:peptidyl-prolyl cis-trans isomerase D
MVFDNENFKENGEKKSSQIAKKINNKEDFFKLAEKQLSQTKQDTKLGWVTKDSLLAELSEDIFNAKQGEVIGPIKSQFGWHLAMVTDKKEEVKVPYAEASIDIKAGLKRQKALDMLYDIATNLDDELGRGTELKKAAEINNLEYKTIDMIDIDGKDENEKFVDNPINSEEFLNVAFSTFLDEESQLEEFNGGYFVLRVDEIIDAKPKKFNQVKDSLIKIWKNNKKQSVAKVEAEKALAKIIDGQSVKSVANKLGYDYEKTEAIKRTESKEVPASVTAEIFRLNVGDASMNISKNGFVVSKLSKIIKAKENKSQKTKLSQKLKKDFGQDLSTGLIASLSRQYDVKINEEVLEKAFYSRYDN